MARSPVLGGGTLNPFGGAGIDFGAFDIGGTDRESRLILTRVEVRWEAGEATDDEYLAALRAYSTTLAQQSSEWLNNEARVKALEYRIKREVIVAAVEAGTRDITDLLDFDVAGLTGLVQDSSEYRQRLNILQNTQAQVLRELEEPIVQKYSEGKMTTAQLKAWYLEQLDDPRFAGNRELLDSVDDRVRELDNRIVDERDAITLDKFQSGKMSPSDFVAYATQARARFVPGTTEYQDWTQRIDTARDQSREQSLLYRYDLSQQYAQLQAFIASNSKGLGGRTSTSTSKRVVLGADGKWKTVTTTSTKAVKPSAAEVNAYKQRQVEIADAKKQMAEIARKLGTVGGAIGTNYMIGWYNKQLTKYAKGSSEWYAVQGKLDSLNDRKHEEAVMASQGIRISYPSASSGGGGGGTSSSPAARGGGSSGGQSRGSAAGGVDLDTFMNAIAKVESGGRYNARNSSSGAYGKYQIMPANWSSWAQKAGLPANAAQTPENQERVAKAAFQRLWNVLKDWRLVAIAWHSGVSVARDLTRIGPNGRNYVNKVSQVLGMGSVTVSNGRISGGGGGTIGSGGSTSYAGTASPATGAARGSTSPTASKAAKGVASSKGPLQVITGTSTVKRSSNVDLTTSRAKFPVNLDGEAFKKFYAQYQQAFKSNAESFSVNTPDGEIHYFIGDDALERIEGMHELDRLRIELFQTRMVAYAGTPSEITAANQYDDAVEDAAGNEFLALSMANANPKTTNRPDKVANPLANAVKVFDARKKAIEDHISLAEAAFKRGDLDAAYSHIQLATSLRLTSEAQLQGYLQVSQGRIREIEKAYGVSLQEALGSDSVVARDLKDLLGTSDELDAALAKGDETLAEIKKLGKKDANGDLITDHWDASGQIVLNDDFIRVFKPNGTVEFKPAPKSIDDEGRYSRDLEGLVKMDVKLNNRTVTAYGEYKVGTVGVIVQADGSTVPIKGKVLQYVDPSTGAQQLIVENPFKPGHWSTTPIRYNAPTAGTFKSVTAVGGGNALQFTTPLEGGTTFTLQIDKDTGVYYLYRSMNASFGKEAVDNELVGSTGEAYVADLLRRAGFARDSTGLSGDAAYWSDQPNPVVGFTAREHMTWRSSGQLNLSPNALTAQMRRAYGELFSGAKTSTKGTYAYSEKGGGADAAAVAAKTGGRAPLQFGGFGGPRLVADRPGTSEAARASNLMATLPKPASDSEAARAQNLRATLPALTPLPTPGGGKRATASKKPTTTAPKTSTKKRATTSKKTTTLKPLPKSTARSGKRATTSKKTTAAPKTIKSSGGEFVIVNGRKVYL